jgi:hypothetical protein
LVDELLEVGGKTRDAVAVVDALRQALIAVVEYVDVVVLAEQIHHVDVLGAVAGPSGKEDERLPSSGFPVGELDAVAGDEGN